MCYIECVSLFKFKLRLLDEIFHVVFQLFAISIFSMPKETSIFVAADSPLYL